MDPLDYGNAEEAVLTAREAFRTKDFLQCIDTLCVQLKSRLAAYGQVCDRFGFLLDFPTMQPGSIQAAAEKLTTFYSNDLDANFGDELLQFQVFLRGYLHQKEEDCTMEQFMYSLMIDKDVQATFPNVEVALKIYLTLMVANCSGERSFSKLKLIKNLMRTTMGQTRLTNLTIMSLESDILRGLDFTEIIHTFALQKARKVVFQRQ